MSVLRIALSHTPIKGNALRSLKSPGVVLGTIAVVLAIVGTATASSLINGIQLKKESVPLNRLSKGTQALILKGAQNGTNGTNGTNGAKGDTGAKGDGGASVQGAKGDTGAQGAKGDTGSRGPTGAMPADFAFTNSSVRLTTAGVQFGRYGNGGTEGGSMRYDGLNGKKLNEITDLVFRAKYTTSDGVTNGVPYLRIFTGDDHHDVIYSPNTQAAPDVAEGAFHIWNVTAGTVRYDNDAGGPGPDPAWADTVAAHGTEVISGIYISSGFTAGHDLSTTVSDFTVNGASFHFPEA